MDLRPPPQSPNHALGAQALETPPLIPIYAPTPAPIQLPQEGGWSQSAITDSRKPCDITGVAVAHQLHNVFVRSCDL